MLKKFFILASSLSLAFVSCEKDQDSVNDQQPTVDQVDLSNANRDISEFEFTCATTEFRGAYGIASRGAYRITAPLERFPEISSLDEDALTLTFTLNGEEVTSINDGRPGVQSTFFAFVPTNAPAELCVTIETADCEGRTICENVRFLN